MKLTCSALFSKCSFQRVTLFFFFSSSLLLLLFLCIKDIECSLKKRKCSVRPKVASKLSVLSFHRATVLLSINKANYAAVSSRDTVNSYSIRLKALEDRTTLCLIRQLHRMRIQNDWDRKG